MINKNTNELVFQSGENWHIAKSSALVDVQKILEDVRPIEILLDIQ